MNNKETNIPILLGGVTDNMYRNKSWYPGDRVYDSREIAVTLAGPCGRTGGYTALYLVETYDKKYFEC